MPEHTPYLFRSWGEVSKNISMFFVVVVFWCLLCYEAQHLLFLFTKLKHSAKYIKYELKGTHIFKNSKIFDVK